MKSLGWKKGSRLRLCFRVVDDVPEKKGVDLWKQMSQRKCSFKCICGIFWPLNPSTTTDLCSVCILPQPAFYSQSAVCILHTDCILPLVRSLQSAVRSLRLTLTGFKIIVVRQCCIISSSSCHLSLIPYLASFVVAFSYVSSWYLVLQRERDSRFNILCVVCTHYSISSIHYSVSCTHYSVICKHFLC